jgi:hypothetical protein
MSADPTMIEMDFDPTSKRMVGIARHGNTPFDVRDCPRIRISDVHQELKLLVPACDYVFGVGR